MWKKQRQGFTLIELSIVLVIIGLIVGGIVAGQDLIRAAAVRAQIAQIEKYQTAVNTFRTKYGYMPGDIPNPNATQLGLPTRGTYAGEGDGNGLLEGVWADTSGANAGYTQLKGENALFWVDLSYANLVNGGFNTATATSSTCSGSIPLNQIPLYMPAAAIGHSSFVYTHSMGDRNNYFGVSAVIYLECNGFADSNAGLTISEAYSIDTKIDDGVPMTGKVLAAYLNKGPNWAVNGGSWGATPPGDASSIFGNGSVAANAQSCIDKPSGPTEFEYSMSANSALITCGLSFRFQE